MNVPFGGIIHIELFARELEESARFYRALFGWTTEPHDAGYLFWKAPGGLSGGFTTAGAPVTNPAATFYIRVDDIEEMLEKIVEHGGVVIREKTAIGGGHGVYALFRDPAGNNIGLQANA
ncbi:MAG TPA: VOC family protein [Bacteroidetes bacterium]|nr:VOC family protein [Bacteroidota bacterium]